MTYGWGLLGPEFLPNARRNRTLGLGASVRHFNDLAVPGLGGVWYGKQVLLATLGVFVAEQVRSHGKQVQTIEVANAIEALACYLAFSGNQWKLDPRLRGSTKLYGKGSDFSFSRVRQRNFYVSQPMRMSTVQALPALGFVDSDSPRFNTYKTSQSGLAVLEGAFQDFHPYKRSVAQHLTLWVCGEEQRVITDELRAALSPLVPLAEQACPLLRERLIQGGDEDWSDKQRRRVALAWVDDLWKTSPIQWSWSSKPHMLSESHWNDLAAGARFFKARDAATQLLDAVEVVMGNKESGTSYCLNSKVPPSLSPHFERLRAAALDYLQRGHEEEDAKAFCSACLDEHAPQVLRALVSRDGHVLRLDGDNIRPGAAFRGREAGAIEDEVDAIDPPKIESIPLPEGMSYRMRNLYMLNADLHGGLSDLLNPTASKGNP